MFGFGITKLLVLVAIVAAVWYGFKFVGRLDEARRRQAGREQSHRRAARSEKAPEIEDTVQCPVCGAYVVARSASPCERPDCPY